MSFFFFAQLKNTWQSGTIGLTFRTCTFQTYLLLCWYGGMTNLFHNFDLVGVIVWLKNNHIRHPMTSKGRIIFWCLRVVIDRVTGVCVCYVERHQMSAVSWRDHHGSDQLSAADGHRRTASYTNTWCLPTTQTTHAWQTPTGQLSAGTRI